MHPDWTASLCVAPRTNSVAIRPSSRLASPAPHRSRCSRGFIHGRLGPLRHAPWHGATPTDLIFPFFIFGVGVSILGVHMWSGGGGVYDPEGLLSTLPAISSALAGLLTGDFLRSERERGPQAATSVRLALGGGALVVAGLVWDLVFPINKPLWTSSYVAWTTGWALVTLAALYWLVEVRGLHRWTRPLVVYGMNAITVFLASGLVAKTLVLWRVRVPGGAGETTSAYNLVYETGFASWAGPLNGSLAFAVATVLLWYGILWAMSARGIYIKV